MCSDIQLIPNKYYYDVRKNSLIDRKRKKNGNKLILIFKMQNRYIENKLAITQSFSSLRDPKALFIRLLSTGNKSFISNGIHFFSSFSVYLKAHSKLNSQSAKVEKKIIVINGLARKSDGLLIVSSYCRKQN